jgi:Activator of aromatic catabolism
MNLSELQLPARLTVDEAAGMIHFRPRRLLLFDAEAMGLLRQELIHTLGQQREELLHTA